MSNVELDLLYTILDERTPYPWNPAQVESEAYLTELESAWEEAGTEASLTSGWQGFSAQLEALWAGQATGAVATLKAALQERFSVRIPANLLDALAQQALALADNGRPLIEQLVACVQPVCTGWNSDDLSVLARPLAFSLRDGQGDILDLHINAIRQVEWDSLSDLEKARLSLAAASVALAQAKQSDPS